MTRQMPYEALAGPVWSGRCEFMFAFIAYGIDRHQALLDAFRPLN